MPAEDLPAWLASWSPDPQWSRVSALDPADRPLLYAGAEHSAWVSAIDAFLHAKRRVAPSLDEAQCRFGIWMAADARASAGSVNALHAIDAVHAELHACGADILSLKKEDRIDEALQRLPGLHLLRDRLMNELKVFLRGG